LGISPGYRASLTKVCGGFSAGVAQMGQVAEHVERPAACALVRCRMADRDCCDRRAHGHPDWV